MKIECMKHGDEEGIRVEGVLRCKLCEEEKQASAKEKYEDVVRKQKARRIVEDLMDPEKMAAHQKKKMDYFKECLVDAMDKQMKHQEKK